MKNVRYVFEFETKKLVWNKVILITAIILLGLLMVSITLVVQKDYRKTRMDFEYYFNEEAEFADYKHKYEAAYALFIYYTEGVTPPPELGLCFYNISGEDSIRYAALSNYRDYMKYKYLYDNGMVETRDLLSYDYDLEGQADNTLLFKYGEYIVFALIAIAILLAYYVFGYDNELGTIKNVLASPVKRRQLFVGKLLFFMSVYLPVFLLYTLTGIRYAFIHGDAMNTMVYYENSVALISCAECYLRVCLKSAVVVFSILSLCILIGQLMKKKAYGIIVPLCIYAVMAVLYYYLQHRYLYSEFYVDWVPFCGLQRYSPNIADNKFIILMIAHTAAAVVFLGAGAVVHSKKEA